MTLIYKYKGKKQSIEELVKNYPTIKHIWNNSIKKEYSFWNGIRINDLIVETSEVFEEEIINFALDTELIKFSADDETIENEDEIPIYSTTDNKPFDLNVLLDTLR